MLRAGPEPDLDDRITDHQPHLLSRHRVGCCRQSLDGCGISNVGHPFEHLGPVAGTAGHWS